MYTYKEREKRKKGLNCSILNISHTNNNTYDKGLLWKRKKTRIKFIYDILLLEQQ